MLELQNQAVFHSHLFYVYVYLFWKNRAVNHIMTIWEAFMIHSLKGQYN